MQSLKVVRNGWKYMEIGKETTNIITDVLVIGGGIGGAFAALKAREGGGNVLVVDKGRMGRTGCSIFTAGTMGAVIPGEDDMEEAFKEALSKSRYLADQHRLRQHIQDIFPLILEMDKYSVPFLKDAQGKFVRAGKGGPVKFRSMDIMEAVRKAALARGVKLLSRVCITELIVENGQVKGAVGFDIEKGDYMAFWARAVVLASGGCRYKGLAPGHRNCTGDGIAAAYRVGAVMGADESENVSSIFVSSCEIGPGMNTFVKHRAEFFNRTGEEIVEKYSSLLPKIDIMTLFPFFVLEVKLGNGPIRMNLGHLTLQQVEDIRYTLPLATRTMERAGILQGDKFVKELECQLASPKGSLGVIVNSDFMSSIKGLYACGETLSTVCSGNNIAQAATSGAGAGKAAATFIKEVPVPQPDEGKTEALREITYGPMWRKEGIEPEQVILALQEAIIPYDVLALKEGSRLKQALGKVQDIRDNQASQLCAYDPHYLMIAHEAKNMALHAETQLRSAIMREESRFTMREDFPYIDDVNWLKWVLVKRGEKGPVFSIGEVPQDGSMHEKKRYLSPMWQAIEKKGLIRLDKDRVEWV